MRRLPPLVVILVLLIASLLLGLLGAPPPAAPVPRVRTVDFGTLGLAFEPNAGQADPSVHYLAHTPDGAIFFTTLSVMNPQSALALHWLGANPTPALMSGDALSGRVNYLRGNDPAHWQTNLPTYGAVTYQDLYPGVDLAYSGTGRRLKGTYTIAPGADPTAIRWQYGGTGDGGWGTGGVQVAVAPDGSLRITGTGRGTPRDAVLGTEAAPVAWQTISGRRVPVAVSYALAADGSVGFALGAYDATQPLTIDPTLTYATYLGGSGSDHGHAITVDAGGNIYVAGNTTSADFPLHTPFQSTCGSCYPYSSFGDAFVTKLNPSGSSLVYSTYLGGSDDDWANAIAVDAAGNVYLAGGTVSGNFPLHNAIQPTCGSCAPNSFTGDAFVAKLNAAGSALVYSTYLGGRSFDQARGIAVDPAGNAYVVGSTNSVDFPIHRAIQGTCSSCDPSSYNSDAFVTAVNAAGSAWIYSTFLGGAGYDMAAGVAVDAAGAAYVTGYTASGNFPTAHAFQPFAHGNPSDAFVTKFTPGGQSLAYSTYLGGAGSNYGYGIAVDGAGAAYVTGSASANNFPLVHPIQAALGSQYNPDAFVTKVNPDGRSLAYSTFLGGDRDDAGQAIAVDAAGDAYVTGYTNSTNFPLVQPIQPTRKGGYDGFVTKVQAGGTAWDYSTYLGSSADDRGQAIALDAGGAVYVDGDTSGTDFPLAGTPVQRTPGLSGDAFVAKIVAATLTGTPPTATRTPTATPSAPPAPTVCGLAWRNVPAPNLAGLAAATAPRPADAWAGGASGLLHWDGATWTETGVARNGIIRDLAAGAPNAVWATDGGLLQWNGSAWLRPAYPTPVAQATGGLSGVAATGPANAWAAGSFAVGDGLFGEVLHWDGQTWTLLSTPPPNKPGVAGPAKQRPAGGCQVGDAYYTVRAAGLVDAWVTGYYEDGCNPNLSYAYVTHCTASGCSRRDRISVGSFAGVDPNDVWGLGGSGFPGHSAMYHWDGTAWSAVAVPDAGALVAAATLARDDIYVLGLSGLLHWNGSAWSVMPGALLPAHPANITAAGPNDLWIVGSDALGNSAITNYSSPPLFADVPAPQPFFAPIGALACRAILSGYSCGGPGEPCNSAHQPYFRPGATITRGQTAKVVALSAGLTGAPATQTFHDVPRGSAFYPWVEQMAARGYLSGYTCGGPGEPCDAQHRPYFRPYLAVTRGQLAKVVALAAGYSGTPSAQTFADVPPAHAFYVWVEQLADRHLISGYTCGGPSEPCDAAHRPYFRPYTKASRAQAAKVADNAFFAGHMLPASR